jgi:hypothetical protein
MNFKIATFVFFFFNCISFCLGQTGYLTEDEQKTEEKLSPALHYALATLKTRTYFRFCENSITKC